MHFEKQKAEMNHHISKPTQSRRGFFKSHIKTYVEQHMTTFFKEKGNLKMY